MSRKVWTSFEDLHVTQLSQIIIIIIVRIEFPPLVEIGVNRGHYFSQETTTEGPALNNA